MYLNGKDNSKRSIQSESNYPAVHEGISMKMLKVICVRPEIERSNPGQGEVELRFHGGLKSYCVHAFF